jgi:alpha-L-rhamnosidase
MERMWWRVRLRDGHGRTGAWSAPASWTAAPRGPWPAAWIHAPLSTPPVKLLRHRFRIETVPRRALLHATARGLLRIRLDGREVGDDVIAPGFFDYDQRVLYRTWEIPPGRLGPGDHVLVIELAEGYHGGPMGHGKPETWPGPIAALAWLHLAMADGSDAGITTDARWRCRDGPTRSAGLLAGEVHDGTDEDPAIHDPAYDDAGWQPVRVLADPGHRLVAHPGEPARRIASFAPRRLWSPRPGIWLADLGQNIAGRMRVRVRGASPGTVIRLRHGEMVGPDDRLYTDNLRSVQAADTWICPGGDAVWEPGFTVHGFQFVEIAGWPDPAGPGPGDLAGVAIASDCPSASTVTCSEARLERLMANIVWTQRDNWLDVPTDCPQRNERLGWTGDIQVFIRSAIANHDVQAFFDKWLADLFGAQEPDGCLPNFAPAPRSLADGWGRRGDAGWGDAGIVCPWQLWRCYGDRRVLERWWPGIRRWLDYLTATADPMSGLRRPVAPDGRNLVVFADWLALDGPPDDRRGGTAPDLVMSAWHAESLRLGMAIAAELGRPDEVVELTRRHAAAVAAFRRAYVGDDGRVAAPGQPETQTGYALALRFGLLRPEACRDGAARLAGLIAARGGKLATGFLGLPHLLYALSDHGHGDLAWRILLDDGYPGWLYSVAQGATTVWERWDGWTRERGPADPGMNSYAHYAYGSVCAWLHEVAAGLEPLTPGFAAIRWRPQPGPVDRLAITYDSAAGRWSSAWERDGRGITYRLGIPCGAEAHAILPAARGRPQGDAPVDWSVGPDGDWWCRLGAGEWTIRQGT